MPCNSQLVFSMFVVLSVIEPYNVHIMAATTPTPNAVVLEIM
ncbi:MAG: hypothetical protein ACLQBD_24115 [Syntrophobacteraceae bacterium]